MLPFKKNSRRSVGANLEAYMRIVLHCSTYSTSSSILDESRKTYQKTIVRRLLSFLNKPVSIYLIAGPRLNSFLLSHAATLNCNTSPEKNPPSNKTCNGSSTYEATKNSERPLVAANVHTFMLHIAPVFHVCSLKDERTMRVELRN